MSTGMVVFLGLLAAGGLVVFRVLKRLGPATIPEEAMEAGRPLLRVHRDAGDPQWDHLGAGTESRGLDLLFHADDDPEAEATVRAPGAPVKAPSTTSRARRVTLTAEWQTAYVHAGGYVFRARVRGAPGVVGKVVRLKMRVDSAGKPWAGHIGNDDDDPAAVGDWVEVEWLEMLDVRHRARRSRA